MNKDLSKEDGDPLLGSGMQQYLLINDIVLQSAPFFLLSRTVILLRPASATGVIVLARSVCVSVCVCVSLSWVNGQTYGSEFWYQGQVEGYLGQVRRSRS